MIPGEQINLRAVEREDIAVIYHWFNDPAVMLGWGWSAVARSQHDVARDVEEWLAREAALGHPAALVGDMLDGDPVGLVLLHVDRPEARSLELSLLIGDPARWGKGLGSDLLQSALDACFSAWGAHRVGIRVDAGNSRAIALYERFGFKLEGRLREAAFLDGHHADLLLYGVLASEWLGREEGPQRLRRGE